MGDTAGRIAEWVDRFLAKHRPDRYEDKEAWIDEALDGLDLDKVTRELVEVEAEAEDVDTAPVLSELLRERLLGAEGQKLRSTKSLWQRIQKTGQLPLDWMDLRDEPILVTDGVTLPGVDNDPPVHAKLGTLTDEDLDAMERYEVREKRKRDKRSDDRCMAYRRTRGALAIEGVKTVGKLPAGLALPEDDES